MILLRQFAKNVVQNSMFSVFKKIIIGILFFLGGAYFLFGFLMSGMRHSASSPLLEALYYFDCVSPFMFFGFVFACSILGLPRWQVVLGGIGVHVLIIGWLYYHFWQTYQYNLQAAMIQREPDDYLFEFIYVGIVFCGSVIWFMEIFSKPKEKL
jgi:hypothetical protein